MKKVAIICTFLLMLLLAACGSSKHIHNFKDNWLSDNEIHWKECPCGEKTEIGSHILGVQATETTPQVCTICNHILKEAIEHTHDFCKTNQKTEAVLGKDGEVVFKCNCGEEKRETIHYYEWFECVNCFTVDPIYSEIKDSFYNKFAEKHFNERGYELARDYIDLRYYYGEYNGCHIINVFYHSNCYEREWLVENESLEYETLKELSAYYNGEFYSLAKALELNLITKEDIEKVIEWDKLYYPAKYHKFTEAELTYLKEATGYSNIKDSWFRGEYNGAYILYCSGGVAMCYRETVNNAIIFYYSGASFEVVYNNKIYTIKEAFLNLILTEDDIDKISLSNNKYIGWRSTSKEEVDMKEPIKLEDKVESDITLENVGTSLVITIDKNFQLLLTEEHFRGIEYETLSKIEHNLINQQYLMTFKNKEDAYSAFIKLQKLYYVLTVNNL